MKTILGAAMRRLPGSLLLLSLVTIGVATRPIEGGAAGNIDATHGLWSPPIAPRNDNTASPGSAHVSDPLDGDAPDTYLNYSFIQTGPDNLPGYNYDMSIDDIGVDATFVPNPSTPNTYFLINRGPYTVRGGRHTLKGVADGANSAPETNEGDNTILAQYLWSPVGLIAGTPLVRAAPPISQGPNAFPLVNADGFEFTRPPSYAWVVSSAARNAGDDNDLSVFDDYSGSESGFSNAIATSRWATNLTDFVVGHFQLTPTTVYPAVSYFTGGTSSYAIDATSAIGHNGNGNSSWTGQLLAANRLADVYEAYMTAGSKWYFTLRRQSGTSDLTFEVFPGTAGTVTRRGAGLYSSPLEYTSPSVDVLTYTASEDGWHPVVVFRDNGTGADTPATYDFIWNSGGLVGVDGPQAPPALEFAGVSPNPVVGAGRFEFVLPAAGHATLELFDLNGRRVRSLVNGELTAGAHSIPWDRRGAPGAELDAGIYWARLEAADGSLTRRVIVMH